MEQIFICLENYGNGKKFLSRIKKNGLASQQNSKGKNHHTTESKDTEILIDDSNSELPSPPTEIANPLISADNQIDIISAPNSIDDNQAPKKITLPDIKIEFCNDEKFKFKKENFVFGELTVGHLFLVERKLLFVVFI